VATAFVRANKSHQLRYSILPLLDTIAKLASNYADRSCCLYQRLIDIPGSDLLNTPESELALEFAVPKDQQVNVDKFMGSLFFKQHSK